MRSFFFGLGYSLLVSLAYGIISLFPKDTKIGRWYALMKKHTSYDSIEPGPGYLYLLVYCPSLGEYQASRSILKRLKNDITSVWIEVCFFSPSGYDYLDVSREPVDGKHYAPLETKRNTNTYFEKNTPNLVIISGHAIWPCFLDHLIKKQIPYVFMNTNFYNKRGIGWLYQRLIKTYLVNAQHIFTNTQSGLTTLREWGIDSSSFSGNIRLSSMVERLDTDKRIVSELPSSGSCPVIVCGSTHHPDEKVINAVYQAIPGMKWIIVPHEIDEFNLTRLCGLFEQAERWSEVESWNADVLIYDKYGDLLNLYGLATIAYVGGGFNAGIHNILEAAIHGPPVIFGPRHRRSSEADEFIQNGMARSVETAPQAIDAFHYFLENRPSGKYMESYRHRHKKAVTIIAGYLKTILSDQ